MTVINSEAQVTDSPALSNRLENPPDMVDHLYLLDEAEDWKEGEFSRIDLSDGGGEVGLVLADERQRAYPRRGRYTTPEIETEFPFTELIPSWNARTPDETGMNFHVSVRDAESGEWSPWLYLGQWGRTVHWPERTLRFEHGAVNVDNLYLSRPADAFKMRANLYSFDLEDLNMPALRRLAVSVSGQVSDDQRRAELQEPTIVDGQWARSLPVPFLAQGTLDGQVSGSTCSPTSVSMLLRYHGVDRPLIQNALDIYDPEYGIFGNWARAAALAGQFGLDAWVRRIRSWDQVKSLVSQGIPVIASIRFEEGEFPSNPMTSSNGHLIVIRGFTPEGDIIVNDPAHRTQGEGIVYNAEELAKAWFEKGGVAYVIRSPERRAVNERMSPPVH